MPDNTIRFEFGNTGGASGGAGARGTGAPAPGPAATAGPQPFDPVAQAQRLLEIDRQRKQVQDEIARLSGKYGPAPDPVREAVQQRLKIEQHNEAVKKAYNLEKYGTEDGPSKEFVGPIEDPVRKATRQRLAMEKDRDEKLKAYNREKYGDEAGKSIAQQVEEKVERDNKSKEVTRQYNLAQYGTEKTPEQIQSAAEKQRRETKEKLTNAVSFAQRGLQTASAAGVPGAGAASSILSAAASGAEAGGPIGAVVAGGLAALKEVMTGIYDKVSNLADTAAKYSPATATAAAMAETNSVLGDMRRSNFLDTELSDFTTAKSQLSEAGNDLLAELLKPAIPVLTSMMQDIVDFIAWAKPFLFDLMNMFVDLDNGMTEGFEDIINFLMPWQTTTIQRLDRIVAQTKPDEDRDTWDDIVNMPPPFTPKAPELPRGQGVGLPGLQVP